MEEISFKLDVFIEKKVEKRKSVDIPRLNYSEQKAFMNFEKWKMHGFSNFTVFKYIPWMAGA